MAFNRRSYLASSLLLASIIFHPAYSADSKAEAKPTATNTLAAPRLVGRTNSVSSLQRQMVDLTSNLSSTAMAFGRNGQPPPWQDGNQVSIHKEKPAPPGGLETRSSWRIVNIHNENLDEIKRRLGTKTIEMVVVPNTRSQGTIEETGRPPRPIIQESAYALIVDPRIPREWFHFEPKHVPTTLAREMKEAYPNSFREKP
jgi:hypothetical protein